MRRWPRAVWGRWRHAPKDEGRDEHRDESKSDLPLVGRRDVAVADRGHRDHSPVRRDEVARPGGRVRVGCFAVGVDAAPRGAGRDMAFDLGEGGDAVPDTWP